MFDGEEHPPDFPGERGQGPVDKAREELLQVRSGGAVVPPPVEEHGCLKLRASCVWAGSEELSGGSIEHLDQAKRPHSGGKASRQIGNLGGVGGKTGVGSPFKTGQQGGKLWVQRCFVGVGWPDSFQLFPGPISVVMVAEKVGDCLVYRPGLPKIAGAFPGPGDPVESSRPVR